MKKIGMTSMLTIAALIVLIPACVTINIYFPAAAAEKAADKIIDDVWQLKPGETMPVKPSALPEK
ncbi:MULTISPECIES: hypothetical protein [Methylotenera]|uniref:hypothetical protein n=1 Tax=Methylotenera TaxID=359407 RepID=UPI000375CDC7|nr:MULTISPECIES: hypothetical protein [Methylotenera]